MVKSKVCEVRLGKDPEDHNGTVVTFEAEKIPKDFLGNLAQRINHSRYVLSGEEILFLREFKGETLQAIDYMQGVIVPIRRFFREAEDGRVKESLLKILEENDPDFRREEAPAEVEIRTKAVSNYIKSYFEKLSSNGEVYITDLEHIGTARGMDAMRKLIGEVRRFVHESTKGKLDVRIRHTHEEKRLRVYFENEESHELFRRLYPLN